MISTAFAGNWPGWRGDGSGVSSETRLPQTWSTNENVRWHCWAARSRQLLADCLG